MKLKSLAFGILAAATMAFATGATAADELELLEPGKLSVATEGTYPPFSMRSPTGELDGLEVRVVREIATRLGLEYVPVLMKWDSLLVGLEAEQFDIISAAMDITAERQKQVTFSDGWLESGGRIIVRLDSDLTAPAEVKDRQVGGLVASNWTKIAEELGATVKSYKAESDGLQDLVNRNVDAIITDAIAGAFAIKASSLPLKMLDESVSSIQKGLAIKKGKPNLTAAINKALAEMIADGTYAEITTDLVGFSPAPAEPIRSLVD